MEQELIGQRIKFLIDALNLKVRTFAQALGIGETNIRNYLDRGTKPSSDVLEKIINSFPQVNMVWLISGQGEPFTQKPDAPAESYASRLENNYGNSVGSNRGGTVTQHNAGATNPSERDTKLALAEKEIQHLREQLAAKDALLASKEETIAVLKTAFNRPS